MMVVVFIMFSMGFYGFVSSGKHLLSSLLMLEMMVLSIFFEIMLFMSLSTLYFSLVFLVYSACEGALGLSLMVVMSRLVGGDMFSLWVSI
uniref:NADH-ubiquinone oxidoreductase chain 4L n=1 Tax=Neelides sp. FZ-2019 TaxID=2583951 RepID=A0A6H0EX71_9HEXA|nr:NADH dehydrogenase subunit 4L [Neelides sp. FZ-2019]